MRREGEEKKEIYVLQVAVQRLASPENGERVYNNETKTGLYFYSFFGVSSRHPLVFGRFIEQHDYVSTINSSILKKKASCSLTFARRDSGPIKIRAHYESGIRI